MIGIQGDNHGQLDILMTNIDMHGSSGMTIFHVGDFGYCLDKTYQDEHRYKTSIKTFNKFLKSRGIIMYVVRGNHDNPSYFDGRFILSNVKLVEDYTVVRVENKNWLLVGGAISIDRNARTHGFSYWRDEVFVLDLNKVDSMRDIDCVVTHNAPEFALDHAVLTPGVVERFSIGYNDPHLLADVNLERSKLSVLCETLRLNNNITHWYYGHYHDSMTVHQDGTVFKCVAIDVMIEHV